MPVNLRQYNVKPNSNYNVSLSLKKGDRVIDGLRSIYVSTPKYLTTGIENVSTASTIIFDRSYQRNTVQEPSVKITSAIPGRSASTQILYMDIKSVKVLTSGSMGWNVNRHYVGKIVAGGKTVNIPAAEDTVNVQITLSSRQTWKGTVSLSSNNPNLLWMNFPTTINLTNDNVFNVSVTPITIDPSITWDGRGYWASTIMSNLVKGVTPKDTEVGRVSYTKEHPSKDMIPGSSVNIAGIYQDVQGLTQTLKTSIQNQDLISQLYWDDIDEPDAIRDVIYFFFRDDTEDQTQILSDIKEWIYLDDSFVAAFPARVGTGVTAVNDSNPEVGFATYTASKHSFDVGENVKIQGATPAGYNGTFRVTAKTANTFTVANATTGAATFSSGYAKSYTSTDYNRATGTNLSKTVPELDESYLSLSEPIISLNKTVYQTGAIYENLATPTQVRVAFTIARYTKNSSGTYDGIWLKTNTSGYPVLSIPEVLSGSS